MKKICRILEYGSLSEGKESRDCKSLPSHAFRELENYVLSVQSGESDVSKWLSLSVKRNIGKVISAKNYVGAIRLKDGTIIEILPKIFTSDEEGEKQAEKILGEILRVLKSEGCIIPRHSGVSAIGMDIFEVFIEMFIDEVISITKRGLKGGYIPIEENSSFYRGKIKFTQQIKFNCVHKERCYIEYDDYNANRPENRLLKAALLSLYRYSSSSKNRKNIKILLNIFSPVETSVNYSADFRRCSCDRNLNYYQNALLWSKMFLKGQSPTPISSSKEAGTVAILFPMEKLFEKYIEVLLRRELNGGDYTVLAQKSEQVLFTERGKNNGFMLCPDIIVKRKNDESIFIIDTKWKILDRLKRNYGISQADMYQMYAYQQKYKAEKVVLLYPKAESSPSDQKIVFESADGSSVSIQFVDLLDVKNSMKKIAFQFK